MAHSQRLDRETLRQALQGFRDLRPYRSRFSAAPAALVGSSLWSLAFPDLAGSIVDAAALHRPGGDGLRWADRSVAGRTLCSGARQISQSSAARVRRHLMSEQTRAPG